MEGSRHETREGGSRTLAVVPYANKDELTRTPKDWMKYGGVYDAAGTRRLVLKFRQGNWVGTPISDPLWAAAWWEMSRKHTRQGLPRPSKRRSWMEMASDRAVAESLGYDPDTMHKKVARWRKRMKNVSLEEFVAKFGGDWTDYLTWVYSPRRHSEIKRARKRRGE